ncbi:unnamed protein product [Rotaria socialis]
MPDNEKVAISEMFTLEPQSLITTNRDVKVCPTVIGIQHCSIGSSMISWRSYFCYDTIDIISNQQGSELLEMMIHHALTLTLFGTSIIRRANIGYLMLALIVEINSVFLHLRKLFHQYNIPRESLIVRLTMVTNIITFLIFRFGLFIYGSITIFRDGERAGSYFHIFLGYILVPTIWIINIVLFYRLLYTDFLKKRKTK